MTGLYLERFGNIAFVDEEGCIDEFGFHFDHPKKLDEFRHMTSEARTEVGYPYHPGASGEEVLLLVSTEAPKAHVSVIVASEDEGDKDDWGLHSFDIELTSDEAQSLIAFAMDQLHEKMLSNWGYKRLSDSAA